MYGNLMQVRYGAYIEKFVAAENISRRDAENKVRDVLGIPRIGQGWASEGYLYKIVKFIFEGYDVLREGSPAWLGNQRLDIFIPDLCLAIEYQGEQHYRPIERFGGEIRFRETLSRDERKLQLCKENGVKLVYFKYDEELSQDRIEKKLKNFLPKKSNGFLCHRPHEIC